MGRTENKIQELEKRILKLESLLHGVNTKLEHIESDMIDIRIMMQRLEWDP